MVSGDMIRGYTDIMILYLLWNEPSYGYEISKRIQVLAPGDFALKETTLYSAIARLEKKNLVSAFYRTADNGKKRTYYQLTEIGRQYYYQKCQEWRATKTVVDRFIKGD